MSAQLTTATEVRSQPAFRWLGILKDRLAAGERPREMLTPAGAVQVEYIADLDSSDGFARVAISLPVGILAEIDDATYGTLFAFRVPLKEVA